MVQELQAAQASVAAHETQEMSAADQAVTGHQVGLLCCCLITDCALAYSAVGCDSLLRLCLQEQVTAVDELQRAKLQLDAHLAQVSHSHLLSSALA